MNDSKESIEQCIFCQIVKNQAPAEKEFENEEIIAFRDINPKAPTHILIVPKKHINSIATMEENDGDLIGRMILIGRNLAKEKNIEENGYRLTFNIGRHAGQVVDHIHLHLLGGQSMNSMV